MNLRYWCNWFVVIGCVFLHTYVQAGDTAQVTLEKGRWGVESEPVDVPYKSGLFLSASNAKQSSQRMGVSIVQRSDNPALGKEVFSLVLEPGENKEIRMAHYSGQYYMTFHCIRPFIDGKLAPSSCQGSGTLQAMSDPVENG